MKRILLPLHTGKVPAWLFKRMVELAREITEIIVYDFGTKKFLELISDPIWFQAFSNVLGFDWHSSGSTTSTIYALKRGLEGFEEIKVFGGKGKDALRTPEEIRKSEIEEKERYIDISRTVAKVDNVLLQDGYQLYIHSIFIDSKGNWAVVQQGMNTKERYARRYHWNALDLKDFFEEPHSNILGFKREYWVLDLTSRKSRENRKSMYELAFEDPEKIERELKGIREMLKGQKTLFEEIKLPREHFVEIPRSVKKKLELIQKINPENFKELIMIKGVGPETIRALSLISYLIYGNPVSFEDPLVFSFAHGGKDGFPFFVKRKVYDKSIKILEGIIQDLKVGKREKLEMMKKIGKYLEGSEQDKA